MQPTIVAPNTAILAALAIGAAGVLALAKYHRAAISLALAGCIWYGLTASIITALRWIYER